MSVIDSYLTSFFVVIAAIVAALFLQFAPISLTGLAASDVGTKFLTLLFMALVIERSVEIYIKNRYGSQESTLQQPVRIAARAVRAHRSALDAASAAVLPSATNAAETKAAVAAKYEAVKEVQKKLSAAHATHLKAKEGAEPELQDLKAKKKKAATIASVMLSLGVAVVGLRVLAQLVPASPVDGVQDTIENMVSGTGQLQTFHAIDILVTALLLSGGADGIHQLVKGFLSDAGELTGTA